MLGVLGCEGGSREGEAGAVGSVGAGSGSSIFDGLDWAWVGLWRRRTWEAGVESRDTAEEEGEAEAGVGPP